MADPVVAIDGLRALRRDLNRLTEDVKGPMYAAMKAAAKTVGEPIAARTRSALEALPRAGENDRTLSGDVRISATRTGMSIRMGRMLVPWAGWVEFGGTRNFDGSHRQFVRDGRYLFPAARSLSAPTADAYSRALAEVFDSASTWTNSTTNPGNVRD